MRHYFFIILFLKGIFSFAQTKNGYIKKTDDKTGKLIYEGEFKNDIPVGKFKYYHLNDSVRALLFFRDNGKVATARLFHPNGKKMAEGKYINKETKDSTWNYYSEDGKIISSEKYVNGKKEGKSFVYFPEGNISEEKNFKDGLEEGEFKQYLDATRIKAKGNYVKGNYHGRICFYYPNGVEIAAGYYVNGNKNGPWIYRNEKGELKDKELYKNGKLCTKKETDEFFSKTKVEQTQTPSSKKEEKKNPAKK